MSTLTFVALRAANLARQGKDGWRHPLDDWSDDDWLIAVGGELGEALNVVKKLNRARDGLVGNSKGYAALVADLGDELADTVLYLDLAMARRRTSFAEQIGEQSFAELRNFTVGYPDKSPPSRLGRRALLALKELAEGGNGGHLLQRLDDLAHAFGIDLGAAVTRKFNATSEKLGFPHRLEAA